ncbi:hypothetical protein BG842_08780 [Haladaptatus sp. W1]|nr:hypothetical protein BG842_08780 [Haladaptatus sp. W1]
MVDLASDLLGSAIPWDAVQASDLSENEKQHRLRSLLDPQYKDLVMSDSVTTSSSVYVPGVLPFDACYWTDYGADGKKICVEGSPGHYGKPSCYQSTPNLGYVDLTVDTFDLKIDRSWSLRKSFSFRLGLSEDGCVWTGQEDLDLCAEVLCIDDLLYPYSPVAALAEAGLKAGIEAISNWAETDDMIDWLFYALAVIAGIAIILLLWEIEIPLAIGAFALA